MIFSVTTPGSRWRRAIRQVSAAGDLSFDDGDVVQPEFVVLDIDEERVVLDARAANIVHIYNDDTARTATDAPMHCQVVERTGFLQLEWVKRTW
jgi:hypothetical protein